jgi:hypothetical protein
MFSAVFFINNFSFIIAADYVVRFFVLDLLRALLNMRKKEKELDVSHLSFCLYP